MSPATATITPAAAFRAWRSASRDVAATCPRGRAAAALNSILNRRGPGSVKELEALLGVSRQTIRNWRLAAVEFDTADVWRIATIYGASPMPATAQHLAGLLDSDTPIDGVDDLFDLFYSDNEHDAARWLLEHRAAYFRCFMPDEAA